MGHFLIVITATILPWHCAPTRIQLARNLLSSGVPYLDIRAKHPDISDETLRTAARELGLKTDFRSDTISTLRKQGFTLKEIGEKLRITKQRVDQILNPNKHTARVAVMIALRNGTIKKPETCQHCNHAVRVQAHHSDYSKPLEVTWLCVACHTSRNLSIAELANAVADEVLASDRANLKESIVSAIARRLDPLNPATELRRQNREVA